MGRGEMGVKRWLKPMKNYVLYDHPKDFPNEYIVREWSVQSDKIEPIGVFLQSQHLNEIYHYMGAMDLYYIPRQMNDDPCIMGVWL